MTAGLRRFAPRPTWGCHRLQHLHKFSQRWTSPERLEPMSSPWHRRCYFWAVATRCRSQEVLSRRMTVRRSPWAVATTAPSIRRVRFGAGEGIQMGGSVTEPTKTALLPCRSSPIRNRNRSRWAGVMPAVSRPTAPCGVGVTMNEERWAKGLLNPLRSTPRNRRPKARRGLEGGGAGRR